MNEIFAFTSTILAILGTGFAILVFMRSFVKDEINHISDAVKSDIKHISDTVDKFEARAECDRRETTARLDQLYSMFVDLLKEGRK